MSSEQRNKQGIQSLSEAEDNWCWGGVGDGGGGGGDAWVWGACGDIKPQLHPERCHVARHQCIIEHLTIRAS